MFAKRLRLKNFMTNNATQEEVNNPKYNIICFSNQLWDWPNWTNKRHVMGRLGLAGHNVIYVDPPINIGKVFYNQIKRGLWGLFRLLIQVKKESGVIVFTPLNLVPFANITSKIHAFRIRRLAAKNFDPALKTVVWVYHVQIPYLNHYINTLDHDLLVYDCVDNYSAFPEEKVFFKASLYSDSLIEQEEYLAKKADVIFASAPGLVTLMKKYNENVHFTPNVGDYDEFKDAKSFKDSIPENLKAIPRPRVGYMGALDDYKFDYALVEKLAKDHPKVNFVIIGPLALKDKNARLEDLKIAEYSNVHLLGITAYKDKKYYLAGFDAEIIPYVLNDYTIGGCFPVKFHDSLAAGNPVIVTDLPAYAPFSDVCYISKGYNDFSENIRKALDEDTPKKIKERQQVAKENNWEGKVAKMLTIIESTFAEY